MFQRNSASIHCTLACCSMVLLGLFATNVGGQLDSSHGTDRSLLKNPQLESAKDNGQPKDWYFVSRPEGSSVELTTDKVYEGEHAALLNCADNATFVNMMQVVMATGYQGRRVRFRASVRTADLSNSTVQLWFRVDRPESMGAFDNMQDRPIETAEWTPYEIVLDVATDATKLNVGIMVIGGSGKAWIDDASLEIVDEETATTTMADGRANDAAADSPPQPFFNHWLWLVAFTALLFVMANVGPKVVPEDGEFYDDQLDAQRSMWWLPKVALRFSFVYWILYSFPSPFVHFLPKFAQPAVMSYSDASQKLVQWSAEHVLKIGTDWVPPSGSGDSTQSYVRVLVCFVLALIVAALWSLIDRRRTDYRVVNDLLRTYLRYVLAFTMIGYGLAKTGTQMNQFPTPSLDQLARSYGDSSPMGLLWTFMGASQAYTRFAGLGEITGGLLLLFRRTTTLGSMVVFGVMVNVMMLNFCYDVPVKQYSAHLVAMATFLLLHDAGRLFNLLLFNRPTDAISFRPPYAGKKTIWLLRLIKIAVVIVAVAIPIGSQVMAVGRQQTTAEAPKEQTSTEEPLVPPLMKRGFRWINEVPFNR